MAASSTDICNSALIKIGAARIASLDDDNIRGQSCKEQYSKLRDEVLRSHPWNFAIKRVALVSTGNTPLYDFTKEYTLPTDCLRVLGVEGLASFVPPGRFGVESPGEFSIEGRKLLSNDSTVNIRYIAQITDTSLFDKSFDEVLAWRIAADLAFSLAGSVTLSDNLFQKYKEMLRDARTFDAQEGYSDNVVQSTQWLASRF